MTSGHTTLNYLHGDLSAGYIPARTLWFAWCVPAAQAPSPAPQAQCSQRHITARGRVESVLGGLQAGYYLPTLVTNWRHAARTTRGGLPNPRRSPPISNIATASIRLRDRKHSSSSGNAEKLSPRRRQGPELRRPSNFVVRRRLG